MLKKEMTCIQKYLSSSSSQKAKTTIMINIGSTRKQSMIIVSSIWESLISVDHALKEWTGGHICGFLMEKY